MGGEVGYLTTTPSFVRFDGNTSPILNKSAIKMRLRQVLLIDSTAWQMTTKASQS
jgi:hypothetical protein